MFPFRLRGNNHRNIHPKWSASLWLTWSCHRAFEMMKSPKTPPPHCRWPSTHPRPLSSWQLHGFSVEGSSGVIIHNTCCLAPCRLSRYRWRHRCSIHYRPDLPASSISTSCCAIAVCTKKKMSTTLKKTAFITTCAASKATGCCNYVTAVIWWWQESGRLDKLTHPASLPYPHIKASFAPSTL